MNRFLVTQEMKGLTKNSADFLTGSSWLSSHLGSIE